MRNRIYLNQRAVNTARKFGEAQTWVHARIIREDIHGDVVVDDALFTYDQLSVARERAAKNREDVPPLGRWERLRIAMSVVLWP